VVIRRRLCDVEPEGAVTGHDQVAAGRLLQALRLLSRAGGAGELERLTIVVREQLRAILGSVLREQLDPLGGEAVLLRSGRARNRAVGDVADEDVQERVLALALDGRAPLAA
jgi:hypothetical protein